ncbi:MAG: YciI family protein [Gemmatimonadota bacterium]
MTDNFDDAPAGRLDREAKPPPHLKRRVARSLRGRGMLASRTPAWFRVAGSAAAALLLVAGGFWLGALAGGAGGDADRVAQGPGDAAEAGAVHAEARYVLLLFEGDDFRPSADEDALVAEYRDWATDLARRGALIAGERLDETGVLLEGPGSDGVALQGGAEGSPLGRLGGYFVVSAADRAEALAIAGTCPHLRHGGRIVVRPIVPT